MAALAVDALPERSDRSYKLKLDGYRTLIIKDGASIRLRLSIAPSTFWCLPETKPQRTTSDGRAYNYP
jgi:hypothetical protein